MFRFFFTIFCATTLFLSCKETDQYKKKTQKSLTIEEANILHNHEGWSDEEINNTRMLASDVIGHRIKESDKTKAHILLNAVWHVHAVLRGRDVTFGEDIKGAWFQFNDDNTYRVGSFAEETGGGRYHYNSDKSILLLLSDDPRMKPQEFNVLINNNAIVFVGEATYKDNNMQCKLHKEDKLPVKPTVSTE